MSVQFSREKRHPQNRTQPTLQGHEDTPAPASLRAAPHNTHRECRCRRAASRSFGRCAGVPDKPRLERGHQEKDFPDSEKGLHMLPAPAYPGAGIFCKPVVLYFSFCSFIMISSYSPANINESDIPILAENRERYCAPHRGGIPHFVRDIPTPGFAPHL